MSAKVTKIIEFDDGVRRWRHDLPDGSDIRHLNLNAEYVGKVTGPTHNPYWLKSDGTITSKAP